ncbi:MAG: PQQ-dependent sugar dehydrogenase [Alphaproteobacteria bacterium]|nr:PQQ-dependent sugar dehydrogenase [Alphaproteobacteria bacterium]
MRFDAAPGTAAKQVALDLSGKVSSAGELGLLGLAFHPDPAHADHVWLYYTTPRTGGNRSVVARFTTSDGGATYAAASERVVLQRDQPRDNHNGGTIHFGPDGMLYIGLGDGGSAGDPWGNAQSLDTWLGKMLRVDVEGDPYAVPPDNPLVGAPGLDEIWAWGLRNPWQWAFDRETGDLWLGDVGQDAFEEIDRIERGRNYGWDHKEGFSCFEAAAPCDDPAWTDPVFAYRHSGSASVVGGRVYRGAALPGLVGTYLFSEFYKGDVRALVFDPITGASGQQVLVQRAGLQIASFAEEADGELLLVGYDGRIFRLTPPAGTTGARFPQRLSETGCVRADDPRRPSRDATPYTLLQPFWSDGLDKLRWLVLPEGTQATRGDDGDWDLPVGTVLMKRIGPAAAPLETRMLVRHEDGDWAGYTYRWLEDGSDAVLQLDGSTVPHPDGGTWPVPSRADCMTCHTAAAGRSLGLTDAQLQVPEDGEDQLARLEREGLVAGTRSVPPLRAPVAETAVAARAWLDVNCAGCHRPGGIGLSGMDLRAATPLEDAGLCGVPSGDGGVLLAPGDAAASRIVQRAGSRAAGEQMPPLGSHRVDDDGLAPVRAWIDGLSACP